MSEGPELQEEAVEAGKSLVDDHLALIVETIQDQPLGWTVGSAYFDLARQILPYLKGEKEAIPDLLEEYRPDVLKGMERALRESGEFDIEKKDPEDSNDPASEYQRLVLVES